MKSAPSWVELFDRAGVKKDEAVINILEELQIGPGQVRDLGEDARVELFKKSGVPNAQARKISRKIGEYFNAEARIPTAPFEEQVLSPPVPFEVPSHQHPKVLKQEAPAYEKELEGIRNEIKGLRAALRAAQQQIEDQNAIIQRYASIEQKLLSVCVCFDKLRDGASKIARSQE